MSDYLSELESMVDEFGTAPTIDEVTRRTLADKGINGPTAAHVIEEVHTPLNLAYLTFTTGSTAFQNIVGVTHNEMQERIKASVKALELAGVKRGDKILVTYAPLVNVFSKAALDEYGVEWFFLKRSSRDAFLVALCKEDPDVILGESSFIRAAIEDARSLGLEDYMPENKILLTAGTPLDLELLTAAEKYNHKVHDLYGCQEFGWLALDGIPVRDDISLVKSSTDEHRRELVVGGLPMGDSFPVSDSGHVCNNEGKIITYRRTRSNPELEVMIKSTTLSSPVTVERAARTMLRIKGRVVKVSPDLKVSASATTLELVPGMVTGNQEDIEPIVITGPEKTCMFDALISAQLDLQQTGKTDPIWNKQR